MEHGHEYLLWHLYDCMIGHIIGNAFICSGGWVLAVALCHSRWALCMTYEFFFFKRSRATFEKSPLGHIVYVEIRISLLFILNSICSKFSFCSTVYFTYNFFFSFFFCLSKDELLRNVRYGEIYNLLNLLIYFFKNITWTWFDGIFCVFRGVRGTCDLSWANYHQFHLNRIFVNATTSNC